MPKNQISKDEFKCKILKLKDELYGEKYPDNTAYLSHKYLNKVLDLLEEYRY